MGLYVLMILAILVGIAFFIFSGIKGVYKPKPSNGAVSAHRHVSTTEKIIVSICLVINLGLAVVESLQVFAAVFAFFLFIYIVWLGVIRPTLK